MKLPPSIDQTTNTVFLVDRSGRLVDHNAAYERFARDNAGDSLLARWGRGCDMYACLPAVIREEVVARYEQVWRTGRVDYRYQCHSPELFRIYHMRLVPYRDEFVISEHSLVVSAPLPGMVILPEDEIRRRFGDSRGIVTQCCSCRKIRSPGTGEEWFWVEAMFNPSARIAADTSHGLCPVCLEDLHPE